MMPFSVLQVVGNPLCIGELLLATLHNSVVRPYISVSLYVIVASYTLLQCCTPVHISFSV